MVHQVRMKVAILGQIPILKIPIMRMLRNWPTTKKPEKKMKAKNNLQECNWPNKKRTRNEKKSNLSKTKDQKKKKGLKKKKKNKLQSKKKSKSKQEQMSRIEKNQKN